MILLVDIDGVCADLHTEWYRLYNLDYQDNLVAENVKSWDIHSYVKSECGRKIYNYLRSPTLYQGVKPIEGALEHIRWLKENGWRIVYVSSAVIGSLDQKARWLAEHGFIPEGKRHLPDVIFAYDKDLIRGQALIDDAPHNIETFPGMGIVMDYPWNQTIKRKHYRIHGWKELPPLLEKLYG